jgi:hypothetical protein
MNLISTGECNKQNKMMRKIFFILVSSFLFSCAVFAQQNSFFTILNYGFNTQFNCIASLGDNGYVAVGTINKDANSDVIIVNLDSEGRYKWSKTIGFYDEKTYKVLNDKGISVLISADNSSFIVLGTTLNDNSTLLLKYDIYGNSIWQKRFYLGTNIPSNIYNTFDKGYVIPGTYNESNDTLNKKLFLIRANQEGVFKWNKEFTNKVWSESTGKASSIALTSDSSYLVAGICKEKQSSSDFITLLSKIDDNGNVVWQKEIGKTSVNFMHVTIHNDGNNYIVLNETPDGNAMQKFSISNDGTILKTEIIQLNGLKFPQNIVKNNNVFSFISSNKTDTSSCYYATISGVALNSFIIAKSTSTYFNARYILSTKDSGFVALAENVSNALKTVKCCIIKLDKTGKSVTKTTGEWNLGLTQATELNSNVSDNIGFVRIANNQVELHSPDKTEKSSFVFYSVSGQIIKSGFLKPHEFKQLPLSDFKRGVYIVKLQTKNGRFLTKLVVN